MTANIATANAGTVSQVIAGWPAVALLIAVKLLSGILEHRGTTPAAPLPDSSGPVPGADARSAVPRSRGRARPHADTQDLLQAARSAWDGLRADGRPLTRDTLAARLRAAGHQVGNDRLTPLLAALRGT